MGIHHFHSATFWIRVHIIRFVLNRILTARTKLHHHKYAIFKCTHPQSFALFFLFPPLFSLRRNCVWRITHHYKNNGTLYQNNNGNDINKYVGQHSDPRCIYVPPSSGKTFYAFRIAYARCGTKPDLNGQFYENTVRQAN